MDVRDEWRRLRKEAIDRNTPMWVVDLLDRATDQPKVSESRTGKVWIFSAYEDKEIRWNDTRFTSAGATVEEAARALVASAQFTEWWDQDTPAKVWAFPMRDPSGVSRIDPERKYLAQEFDSLWDESNEIEVVL